METAVLELRQYTLRPGQRDTLISLFEREFVESQEALGMRLVGLFRDVDNPDRFVWLRAFAGMPQRAEGLQAFYGGPIWKAHRDAANATMIDSDNVLLLRPSRPDSGFPDAEKPLQAPSSGGMIVAAIHYLGAAPDDSVVSAFEQAASDAGVTPIATYVTELSANNFPALPVRENEPVLVWFARGVTDGQRVAIAEALADRSIRDPEELRLAPTSRSRLR
jgi:hypothetical protein